MENPKKYGCFLNILFWEQFYILLTSGLYIPYSANKCTEALHYSDIWKNENWAGRK